MVTGRGCLTGFDKINYIYVACWVCAIPLKLYKPDLTGKNRKNSVVANDRNFRVRFKKAA